MLSPDTLTDVDGFNATDGNAVLWLLAGDDTLWQREVSNSGSWPWWSSWPTVLYSDVLPPGTTPDAGGETGWKSFYSKYIPTAGGY